MIRVLFYGGCHARVMEGYLRAAFGERLACASIVNFELIASGAPFPVESLGDYDALVFSPIDNKPGYETSELVAACGRRGVAALCFPWLEWHGYHPGAAKGSFRGQFRWHYPALVGRAAAHRGGLDAFCDAVVDEFPADALIDEVAERSMAHIRGAEARQGIAPVLSAAIARDFRRHRLFLVPDHPVRRVYVEVLAALLARLGVEKELGIEEDEVRARLDALPPAEPQWHCRMPIFPRVARRLGLAFGGEDPGEGERINAEWVDDDIHPGLTLGLRDYLAQYLDEARGGHTPPRRLAEAGAAMRAS